MHLTGPISSAVGKAGPAQTSEEPAEKALISLAIFAWNEEKIIGSTLASLFGQSIFSELSKRGLFCEVVCVVNGCSDKTPEVASRVMMLQEQMHPYSHAFRWRVANIPERGKLNAWNKYVHSISAPEAEFLIMMDADIQIFQPNTLWNMIETLRAEPEASVAVDRPLKHILLKEHKTVADRISLAMSRLTGSAEGQLCGQLYAIRSKVARNIYLPRDLAACEDGFIKALVCTDFLSHSVMASRIRIAKEAEHTFEAYTNPTAILKNQKRQIIGQTFVHILIDQYLKGLPEPARAQMAETLLRKEQNDPGWLKQLLADHLRRTRFFWRLYPGLIGHRFKHLRRLKPWRRAACFPAAMASTVVAFIASFMAWRAMRAGSTDYWPKAERGGMGGITARGLKPA